MLRPTLLAALFGAALPITALAQTADELKNDEKSPSDVLVYGMGYSGNRFSPLTQINKQHVGKLLPVWSYSLADQQVGEGFPLVKDGVIYATTHDAPVTGYALTGAPLIVNGVVIAGVAGAEFSHRGFLEGYDAKTGKHLWRTYTIPAKGEPGSETWEGDSQLTGGGSSWVTGTYDPELDLVYWGIGNPAPWNARARKGDNLFTNSVFAIRPKTGERVWYFQTTPHDPFY